MPTHEERRKIASKNNQTTLRELYEVTKTKFKKPDDDHYIIKTHWEGVTYTAENGKWVKSSDKKKFNNEIDAKIWVNDL